MNIGIIFAISLLLNRVTIIFGELMLFALLALWTLWDIAAHNGAFHGLSGTDPALYQLPLAMLLLVIIFAANHYHISKQSISKMEEEKNLGWSIRHRFYLVLKLAIGYAIIAGPLSVLLPAASSIVSIVGGAAVAVYWDKLKTTRIVKTVKNP